MKYLGLSTQVLIVLFAIMSLALSGCGFSSSISFWALINQLQLYLLLVLTGSYLPRDVLEYITGNEFMRFSLNYMPFSKFYIREELSETMDMPQDTETLYNIGLESRSAFVNLLYVFMILLLISVLHLILKLVKLKVNPGQAMRTNSFKHNVFWRIWRMFTFSIYLRILQVGFLYIFICCTSEIYSTDVSKSSEIVSYTLAWILLLL